MGETSVAHRGPALLAPELRPDEPDLLPLAQALALEASAGHTGLLQAPPDASPARLLDAVAGALGPGLRVAHLDGVWRTPEELAAAALKAATGVRPDDPCFVFEAYLAHLQGREQGLVVLIDDVNALPPATLGWLRERIAAAGGALRVVAAAGDGGSALAAAHRFGLALALPSAPARPAERSGLPIVAMFGLTALALGVLALGALW